MDTYVVRATKVGRGPKAASNRDQDTRFWLGMLPDFRCSDVIINFGVLVGQIFDSMEDVTVSGNSVFGG